MKEEELDPSQEVVLRMDALMKGLRRKKVSKAHRERVLEFLKEHRKRHLTPSDAFPSDEWYRENAHSKDEECEVDSNALVSRGDDGDGAYVQAWTWVSAPKCSACMDEPLTTFADKLCKKCKEEADEDGS
jgi:hypothetical protein